MNYPQTYYHPSPQIWRCPYCGCCSPPVLRTTIATTGWVLMFLTILFFPLCLLWLLIRNRTWHCLQCGREVNHA